MSIVRTLLHLLLSLALVAGALVPEAAQAADETRGAAEAITADGPPCHDAAGDPVQPSDADVAPGCCDGGSCACDCLHHSPVVMSPVPRLPTPAIGAMRSASGSHASPSLSPSPSLRPPIA